MVPVWFDRPEDAEAMGIHTASMESAEIRNVHGADRGDQTPAGWWPSRVNSAVYLDCLSEDEAGEFASAARQELFFWIVGMGLHPVSVMERWRIALARFLPGRVPTDLRGKGAGNPGAFSRAVIAAVFPGRSPAKECKRIRDVLHGLAHAHPARYVWMRDGRSLGDVMEWIVQDATGDGDVDREEDVRSVVDQSMRSLCEWIAQDGAWGISVLKRIHGLAYERYRMAVGTRMTLRDLSSILDQGRAAGHEDIVRFFEEPLEAQLGYRPKTQGQKSAESSAAYQANAERHCPRRQLDLRAGSEDGVNRDEEEATARKKKDLVARRMEAMRRAELERDAAEFEDVVRKHRGNAARRRVRMDGGVRG